MKLEEFEDVPVYPKHNKLLFITGYIVSIISILQIAINIKSPLYYVILLLSTRIIHYSYLGYNAYLSDTYYQYLGLCIKRGLNLFKFKQKCIAKHCELSHWQRYVYAYYKSSTKVLQNLLTILVFVTLVELSLVGSILINSFKVTNTMVATPASLETKTLAIAKTLESYIGMSFTYEILYSADIIQERNTPFMEELPQISVVSATCEDKFLYIYVDIYLNKIVAIDQFIESQNRAFTIFKTTDTLNTLGESRFTTSNPTDLKQVSNLAELVIF